jgi:predicted nucleotidyltransferase
VNDRSIVYVEERAQLLDSIISTLRDDERMVAAWLAGSFGRGEADDLSDLDMHLVIDDSYAPVLCRRESMVVGGTIPERLELVSSVGRPLVIHENHHNAPAGGTFTFVVYEHTAQQVDWTLVPHSGACRPLESVLLFERVTIPACPAPTAPDEDSRNRQLTERLAFFWMMAMPTIKYALRGDDVYFHILLDTLDRTASDIERLMNQEAQVYQRGSKVTLHTSQQRQLDAVRDLCNRVVELQAANGAPSPASIMDTLESLMSRNKG